MSAKKRVKLLCECSRLEKYVNATPFVQTYWITAEADDLQNITCVGKKTSPMLENMLCPVHGCSAGPYSYSIDLQKHFKEVHMPQPCTRCRLCDVKHHGDFQNKEYPLKSPEVHRFWREHYRLCHVNCAVIYFTGFVADSLPIIDPLYMRMTNRRGL